VVMHVRGGSYFALVAAGLAEMRVTLEGELADALPVGVVAALGRGASPKIVRPDGCRGCRVDGTETILGGNGPAAWMLAGPFRSGGH